MATWTTIPDSSIEPGKPIRSIDGIALRDNPIAIAEGASGAPRIEDAALDATVTNAGRDWVLARTAAAGAGAVGTYAFLSRGTTSTSAGDTVAGSALRYAGAPSNFTLGVSLPGSLAVPTGGAPSGTWRCVGQTGVSTSGNVGTTAIATLWLRIS